MIRRALVAVVAVGLSVLTGCAGWLPLSPGAVQPGMARDAVIARWGTPTAALRLPDGERLQYSLQPRGHQAWMVDLDASGRVRSVRQALNDANFSRVEPGRWTRADVLREFGPPAMEDRVWSWNGPVLTWRWHDGADMFFYVYLDTAGTVQRTHYGMEFINAPADRD